MSQDQQNQYPYPWKGPDDEILEKMIAKDPIWQEVKHLKENRKTHLEKHLGKWIAYCYGKHIMTANSRDQLMEK